MSGHSLSANIQLIINRRIVVTPRKNYVHYVNRLFIDLWFVARYATYILDSFFRSCYILHCIRERPLDFQGGGGAGFFSLARIFVSVTFRARIFFFQSIMSQHFFSQNFIFYTIQIWKQLLVQPRIGYETIVLRWSVCLSVCLSVRVSVRDDFNVA